MKRFQRVFKAYFGPSVLVNTSAKHPEGKHRRSVDFPLQHEEQLHRKLCSSQENTLSCMNFAHFSLSCCTSDLQYNDGFDIPPFCRVIWNCCAVHFYFLRAATALFLNLRLIKLCLTKKIFLTSTVNSWIHQVFRHKLFGTILNGVMNEFCLSQKVLEVRDRKQPALCARAMMFACHLSLFPSRSNLFQSAQSLATLLLLKTSTIKTKITSQVSISNLERNHTLYH